MEDLRVFIATYNVGTSQPPTRAENLYKMLIPKDSKKEPDIYVISLQEVKAKPQDLLLDVFWDDPWTAALREILKRRHYIKIKTIRLQGLVLNVFALRRHLLNIRDVETNYTRTGLSGMWGNKGAVSIRLNINGCSICCVNAHLSAHDNQLKDRIDDYNDIVSHQEFHVDGHTKIFFHDYVFWMGDLNFRLLESFDVTPEEIARRVAKGELRELYEHDQLRHVMSVTKEALSELREANLDDSNDAVGCCGRAKNEKTELPMFAPTFKFEVGSIDRYDCKRKPAWTDRILYAVHSNNYENTKLELKRLTYDAHPCYTQSDHKPVTSEFLIKVPNILSVHVDSIFNNPQVFSDYGEEIVIFEKIPYWLEDEENVIHYQYQKHHNINDDWISVVDENFDSLDEYIAYEYVRKPSPRASPLPGASSSVSNAPNETHQRCLGQDCEHRVRQSLKFSEPPADAVDEKRRFRLVYYTENEHKVISVLGVSEAFSVHAKGTN